jgi:hypothetical protein
MKNTMAAILLAAACAAAPAARALNNAGQSAEALKLVYITLAAQDLTLDKIEKSDPQLSEDARAAREHFNAEFPGIRRKAAAAIRPFLGGEPGKALAMLRESAANLAAKFDPAPAASKEYLDGVVHYSAKTNPEVLCYVLALTYEKEPYKEFARGYTADAEVPLKKGRLAFKLPVSWRKAGGQAAPYAWKTEGGTGGELFTVTAVGKPSVMRNAREAESVLNMVKARIPEGAEYVDSGTLQARPGYWIIMSYRAASESGPYNAVLLSYAFNAGTEDAGINFAVTSAKEDKAALLKRLALFRPLCSAVVGGIKVEAE